MEKSKISAIILSAGYSSRMKKFKPLLPIDNMTILEKAICNFKNIGINDIKVVLGHRQEELIAIVKEAGVNYIVNNEYDKGGMFASVITGVKAIEENTEAFFILPVDNPVIKVSTLNEIIDYYKEHNCEILYPKFNGKRGHPPLISTTHKSGILKWSGDGGLRNYLSLYDNIASGIEVVDHGVVIDMDYMEDYEYLIKYYNNKHIPDYDECTSILSKHNVDERVIIHMKLVQQVAEKLAVELNKNGYTLDIGLINAAALLHDIGKGREKHALVGSDILRKYGYDRVAEIVEKHMDILEIESNINEEQIVYLADKLVKEIKVVSIENRFINSKIKYQSDMEILKNINRKQENAEKIKKNIEAILSKKIEDIL